MSQQHQQQHAFPACLSAKRNYLDGRQLRDKDTWIEIFRFWNKRPKQLQTHFDTYIQQQLRKSDPTPTVQGFCAFLKQKKATCPGPRNTQCLQRQFKKINDQMLTKSSLHLTDQQLFIYAAKNNMRYILVFLLKHTLVDVNVKDASGLTALMVASGAGHARIVSFLLYNNADVNMIDEKGKTALMSASENGHCAVVRLLLGNNNIKINIQDEKGKTALILAVVNGHKEIVRLLLDRGADVNIQDENSYTALILASANGFSQIVGLLLEYGANVNIQDYSGNTALILAVANGYKDIVKLLLAKNADPTLKNTSGVSAPQLALKNTQIKRLFHSLSA